MKFAVAYMSYFDGDLKLTTVEADDPITAMVEGARKLIGDSESNEWLNSMLENIPSPDSHDEMMRIEEIRQKFFNVDQVIAVIAI
jgi:hypothetical protein